MIIQLKIPIGISRLLVQERTLRVKYQTNRQIKYYGFFCILKSTTTSGLIQNYLKQIDFLCSITKRSKSSFYNYINACIKLGLLVKEGNSLRLKNWTSILAQFNLKDKAFLEYEYDIDNKEQTPEYFMMIAEIRENQSYQVNSIIKEIQQNPQLKDLLNEKKVNEQTALKLHRMQVQTFINGCGGSERIYSIIHCINADFQRNASKLRKDFNFKSHLSVAYMKYQLVKRGLAQIQRRFICSESRMRKNRNQYFTGWDEVLKVSTWQLPDEIILKV